MSQQSSAPVQSTSTTPSLFGSTTSSPSPSPSAAASPNANGTTSREPIVRTQTPIFACVPASYNYTGGTAPYPFIFLIRSGDDTGRPLKTLPAATEPGTGSWGVDIRPGTSITFVVVDSLGVKGYSTPIVVQTSDNQACLDALPSNRPPSLAGPIAGGVIGGLVALSALLALIWFAVLLPRRRSRRDPNLRSGKPSEGLYEDEGEGAKEAEGGGEAGARVTTLERQGSARGTFNLQDLRFSERSLAEMQHQRERELEGVPLPIYEEREREEREEIAQREGSQGRDGTDARVETPPPPPTPPPAGRS